MNRQLTYWSISVIDQFHRPPSFMSDPDKYHPISVTGGKLLIGLIPSDQNNLKEVHILYVSKIITMMMPALEQSVFLCNWKNLEWHSSLACLWMSFLWFGSDQLRVHYQACQNLLWLRITSQYEHCCDYYIHPSLLTVSICMIITDIFINLMAIVLRIMYNKSHHTIPKYHTKINESSCSYQKLPMILSRSVIEQFYSH